MKECSTDSQKVNELDSKSKVEHAIEIFIFHMFLYGLCGDLIGKAHRDVFKCLVDREWDY